MLTMDKGPWNAVQNPEGIWHVASEDFEHDVWLDVCGDFASTVKRKLYCEWLAAALNRAAKTVPPLLDGQASTQRQMQTSDART
jgi:hypothetical protein